MTKKNLKPQQAAPVQREVNTTFSEGGTGLIPSNGSGFWDALISTNPFAGDDAE